MKARYLGGDSELIDRELAAGGGIVFKVRAKRSTTQRHIFLTARRYGSDGVHSTRPSTLTGVDGMRRSGAMFLSGPEILTR